MRSLLQKNDLSNAGLSFHTSPKPPTSISIGDSSRGRGGRGALASSGYQTSRGRGQRTRTPENKTSQPTPSQKTSLPPPHKAPPVSSVSKSGASYPVSSPAVHRSLDPNFQNQVPRNISIPPPSPSPRPVTPCAPITPSKSSSIPSTTVSLSSSTPFSSGALQSNLLRISPLPKTITTEANRSFLPRELGHQPSKSSSGSNQPASAIPSFGFGDDDESEFDSLFESNGFDFN